MNVPSADPNGPSEIQELAVNCVQYVQAALGVELDGTSDTLPVLDHYIISARAELVERPELESLVVRSAGAYFGIVLATDFDGFWRIPSPDIYDWLLCLHPVYMAVNPIGIAFDALKGHSQHPGPSSQLLLGREERAVVSPRLEALPPIAEDDYFRLSTRYDAFEVAYAALRERMVDEGQSDILFQPEDYDELVESPAQPN
jgi:hypothetical protein